MRIIIFTTIFLSVFIILSVYISRRFINKLDFNKSYKNALNIFLILNLLGVFSYLIFRYYPIIPNSIYFLLSIPIGIIFLLFTTTVIYDIFNYTLNKSVKNKERRMFLKKSLDLGSLALATTVNAKALYNARHVEIENVTIHLPALKNEYTLVQLSDVHIGGLIDATFIASIVRTINEQNCDAVVITGDLIDTDIRYAKEALEELKHIQSKFGTFFVVGNHEYFHNIEILIEYLKNMGITVLENQHVYIGEENQGFNLAGVHDVFGYNVQKFQPDIAQALNAIKEDSPTVLLAHQPKYIYEVPNMVNLVLSGHTHGGQLIPFNFLVRLVQPYIKGLYQHNPTTQIYVNKGTGFWGPPMRLGASSEITVIKLRSEHIL